MEKKDLTKARSAFLSALSNEGSAQRKNSAQLPVIYNNLAGVLIETRMKPNIEKGIHFLNLSKKIAIKLHGEESVPVAMNNRNLGGAYVQLKRIDKGLELLKQAAQTYLGYFGPDHPATKGTFEMIEFVEKKNNG